MSKSFKSMLYNNCRFDLEELFPNQYCQLEPLVSQYRSTLASETTILNESANRAFFRLFLEDITQLDAGETVTVLTWRNCDTREIVAFLVTIKNSDDTLEVLDSYSSLDSVLTEVLYYVSDSRQYVAVGA